MISKKTAVPFFKMILVSENWIEYFIPYAISQHATYVAKFNNFIGAEMKKKFTFTFLFLLVATFAVSQVHIGGKFTPKLSTTKPDSAYFGDIGVRGAWVTNDLNKDGKPEILLTDYTKTGRVHAFQAKNNDTLEWIWSSPLLNQTLQYGTGGGSTPRTIRSGDLDGDGKGEIIFLRLGGGFLVFEWDGVVGSHKFGTKPSAVIPPTVVYGPGFGSLAGTAVEGGLQSNVEHYEIMDIDKDGIQELITPKNLSGSVNDDYLIISAIGEWAFEEQGFASFQIEGATPGRSASTKYGGGSPYAIHPADLDGDGKFEMVCHNWNFGDYFVIKATGPDTYVLADTANPTNGNQFYRFTPTFDHVALFGGTVADLDKDGNQEVYFPMFADDGPETGSLFVINYKPGDNVLKADATRVARVMSNVSQNISGNPISSFSATTGDFDGNGKGEIIVASSYPSNVVAVEFQGGDIIDPANYIRKVYYTGEGDIYSGIAVRDSLGTKDTVRTRGEGFVSKLSPPIDIDGDGKLELALPYQALADSITYSWQTYDIITSVFVIDSSRKVTNPKKWVLRLLERDKSNSVYSKDMVIITPDDYVLQQNYPNPFNPTTNINFVLPLDKKISLKIYDMLGKEVRSLISNEDYTKGSHIVEWNGKNNSGRQVASGTYIAKMTSGNLEKTIKMVLLK